LFSFLVDRIHDRFSFVILSLFELRAFAVCECFTLWCSQHRRHSLRGQRR